MGARFCSLLTLLFGLCAADASAAPKKAPKPPAPAPPPSQPTREDEAREAVKRGFAAFARGDAEAALVEYQRAEQLVPEANLPYRYAAEALVKLGRTEEAIASLEKYLALKPDVSDATATRALIDTLRASLPSKLTLECSSGVGEITVRVDGAAAAKYACPAELQLPGGEHNLNVHAEGKRDALLKITASPGADVHLAVAFEDPLPVAAPAPASASSDGGSKSGHDPPSRPLRTLGFVSLGVGAAALATAMVVDFALLGPAIDDFHAAVDRGDKTASDKRATVQTFRAVSIVGYAAAAALAATGGVLLLVSPSSAPASASARSASALRMPDGAVFELRARF